MVVVVVLTPVAAVWSVGITDASVLQVQVERLQRCLRDAAGEPDPAPTARRCRAWLRRLEGPAAVTLVPPPATEHWYTPVQAPFFGPEGPGDPEREDARLGALHQRPEVIEARRSGEAARCQLSERGLTLTCAAALRRPDGTLLHAQLSTTRLLRSLYEERYPLSGVMAGVGVVGGLLGLWLGWRMVRPLESLRAQVLARTQGRSTAPVQLDRRDEIGDLAQAFNQLLDALAEQRAQNESFVADLAHELKNPAAAIRGAAEVLEGDRPLDPARRARLARVLSDSAQRIAVVMDGFAQLARAEGGLQEEPFELVQFDRLLDALASALLVPEPLQLQVSTTRAEVWANAERLETAVRNLLTNALAFARSRVQVQLRAEGETWVLTVDDDGPGIPEEERDRVFQRWYTTRSEGSGLGLALVRAILEAHRGAVRAERSPLGGARFRVELPSAGDPGASGR